MSRLLAVIAVIFTLLVQVYFAGFLLNLVPLGIDTGSVSSPMEAVLINLAVLALFGGAHSLMARPWFKRAWVPVVGDGMERVVYGLVSAVLLLVICVIWQPLPAVVWSVDAVWLSRALLVLFAGGGLLIAWSIWTVDPLHFTGLAQAFGRRGEPPFALKGPYRWMRHPIQSGLLLLLWATPTMSVGHLLLSGVLTVYAIAATLALEERDLRRQLGESYRDYQRRVPAFFPRLW